MHTFGKVVELCVVRKADVLLGRKAVTIKRLGPRVTLAGEHRGTAVPHCHTQTPARLNKSAGEIKKCKKMLYSECKHTAITIEMKSVFAKFTLKKKRAPSPYVSRQTGAMMEQRKAWASGWQPVCSRGLQSSDRGTTSASRLLWPKKLGSRISEYPTSLQTFICWGMVTQRVDWLMSKGTARHATVRRAAVRNTAMPRESTREMDEFLAFLLFLPEVAWWSEKTLLSLNGRRSCRCSLYIQQGQPAPSA